ncbi:hypothetical protein RVS70_05470 [Virgibacillus sp. M23]|uniref:hypothetical protein n=1 Tax=Virgibacillus sp. M23 TaxID=3079030 RepID=UPI002A91DEF7|nr:hypothetical protein [Virgibacillus sp. M23]MDY7043651.1 hypothetical protein [Virgibacillus sp. M23]
MIDILGQAKYKNNWYFVTNINFTNNMVTLKNDSHNTLDLIHGNTFTLPISDIQALNINCY